MDQSIRASLTASRAGWRTTWSERRSSFFTPQRLRLEPLSGSPRPSSWRKQAGNSSRGLSFSLHAVHRGPDGAHA